MIRFQDDSSHWFLGHLVIPTTGLQPPLETALSCDRAGRPWPRDRRESRAPAIAKEPATDGADSPQQQTFCSANRKLWGKIVAIMNRKRDQMHGKPLGPARRRCCPEMDQTAATLAITREQIHHLLPRQHR